jgi:hypothetical protein
MNHTDIHLLLTGDELMSGDTVDSNSAMIAQSLAAGQWRRKKARWGTTGRGWLPPCNGQPARAHPDHERRAGPHPG